MNSKTVCLPWHIVIYSKYAVKEDNNAQHRRRDEELSINTQPGKIQSNLFSKILPVITKTACKPTVSRVFQMDTRYHAFKSICKGSFLYNILVFASVLKNYLGFAATALVPDQVDWLIFEHDSIVGPFFMEELKETLQRSKLELIVEDFIH